MMGEDCIRTLWQHTATGGYSMNNENKDTQQFKALLREAGILAEKINLARFQETVPTADHTVELCFILDTLLEMEN
jgi:hypothetical protein